MPCSVVLGSEKMGGIQMSRKRFCIEPDNINTYDKDYCNYAQFKGIDDIRVLFVSSLKCNAWLTVARNHLAPMKSSKSFPTTRWSQSFMHLRCILGETPPLKLFSKWIK